ncbi:DNA-protecting protein DprA [Candidatus Peregrinibacteria bacterium]|nr:DNA-protecting protein DprA [Candidatus Peregrinibacteria bacterium]
MEKQEKHLVVYRTDPLFPSLLKETADPPQRLFYAGQELNPHDKYFAIVGTRHPTPYGIQMAEAFSAVLARAGFVIVSGLAYGIDGAAHQAALDVGGRTIAVLGSGLNNITPYCNRSLAKEIQKTGTIITEYAPNDPPHKGTFPRRNRIIAGMSKATLVIEAPEKSGALITARLALEYNHDVFAIPGNITQETSRGTNRLIRDGNAFPVTCPEDIFEYLGITAEKSQFVKNCLSGDENTIYELLKKSSLSIDQLIAETNLPTTRIIEILSRLEIKSFITIIGAHAFVTR